MKYLIAFVVALAAVCVLAACASLPAKQTATLSLQATHIALSEAQDTERQFYAAKTIPNLTPARHGQFAQFLSNAFDAEVKAGTALIAWRSGDPPPPDLTTLMANVRDALTVGRELTNSVPTNSLLDKLNKALAEAQKVLSAIGGQR